MTHRGVNAVAESFFSTLEPELLGGTPAATRAEARRAIGAFIGWYNGERRHSTLGYTSPVRSERQLADTRRAA